MIDKTTLHKMRVCSALLPPPGGDVVTQLLDEIERLREECEAARNAALGEAIDAVEDVNFSFVEYPGDAAADAIRALKENSDE